ncbi:MAG: BrnT family toxin [Chloroflexi bacterium]|nr:BrnT family toxin [Chloroflexota bacterium]
MFNRQGSSELDWDDRALHKIAAHRVSTAEVAEVVFGSRHLVVRVARSRYLVYGQSDAGRYLKVVLDKGEGRRFHPVTAYDMDEADRRLYHRKVRG